MAEDVDTLKLWGACYSGNVDLAQALIEDGVDFCQPDRNGETVLHMAARSDSVEVVTLLLDYVDPNVQNDNGQTPLHLSASKGYTEVIKALLQADCDTDIQTNYSRMTALHIACQNNRGEVVDALLEGGAVCNLPDAINKPAKFYTDDLHIHELFAQHNKHCTHTDLDHLASTHKFTPRRYSNLSRPNTGDDESPERQEDEERRGLETPGSDGKAKRPRTGKKKGKRKGKKFKINFGLDFSEEHKKRMQTNVFDRLMKGKK